MDDFQDPLYPQVVDYLRANKRTTTSDLQRSFQLGYNRAARLIERMIGEGIATRWDKSDWYGIQLSEGKPATQETK